MSDYETYQCKCGRNHPVGVVCAIGEREMKNRPAGNCIVCGSDMLLEIWRSSRLNRKIHCNHCGSEIAPHIHEQGQLIEAPCELKAEISRLLKDAFDCGFNATDEHAFWHFDGPALADETLDESWRRRTLPRLR